MEKAAGATEHDLGTAAVELLGELIQIDTVNPPGNEAPAQELLADLLSGAGFDCELLAAEPGRPNMIARLRGEATGPRLCLIGHVDTVTADPADWSFDPWAGDVADGEVLGRGAQDMKGQVAAQVAAAVELGRSGWRPERGDLLIVTLADEETGGELGARWLCETHPEKLEPDYVVNEGGGIVFEAAGARFYPLCVAEKGIMRFKLRTSGRAGHASVPGLGDNALLKLAPIISRLAAQPPIEPTPEGVAFRDRFVELLGDAVRPVGLEHGAMETLDAAMRELGLVPRALPRVERIETETWGEHLRKIRDGRLSWTWRVREEDRLRAVEEVWAWGEARFGDLDAPRPVSMPIRLRAYDVAG